MAKSSNMMLSWIMKGKLDQSLIKATRETAKHIDSIKKSASSLGKQFSALSGPLKAVKTAMIGSVAGTIPALMLIAKNTAASGDQFDKMSQKAGISAKTLSQLSHAANMSGVSTEQFGANILKLNQQIASAATGNKSAQLAFKRAGVNIRDSSGKLKTADQVMLEMSDTFKKMPEGIYKSDLAMAVFGKSGADMIPLLQGGSESIKDLMTQADELGMTFSNDEAVAGAEFCDSLDLLKKSARGLTNTIGKQLIPVITPLIQSLAKWISANRELISNKIAEFIDKFRAALPQIKELLIGIWTGINNTANAMGGWTPILKHSGELFLSIKAIQFAGWLKTTGKAVFILSKSFLKAIPAVVKFGIALLANPVGLVIAGIAALVAAGYFLYKNWDKVVAFIKNMWNGVKTFFSEKFDSITKMFDDGFINGILNLLKNFNPVTLVMNAIDGIFKYFTGVSLIDEGSKFIKSFGDGIVNTWQSIKKAVIDTFTGWMPDWLKSGFKTVGVDIDAVRSNAGIDVDAHHANGAIVRHRQIAEIGEDGPEAVIPLTKPARGKQLLMQSAKIMGLNLNPVADNNAYSTAKNLTSSPVTQKINVIDSKTDYSGASEPFIDVNNFIRNTTEFITNAQKNAGDFFSNAQKKLSSLITENQGFSLIDELTNGLAQTINNNNQKTSFSPSFNPTITITGVLNSDEIKKQIEKVLNEQRVEFEKQFKNYQYQRQRIGVS